MLTNQQLQMTLFERRVQGLQYHLSSVSEKKTPSIFLGQALKDWELLGPHKAKSVFYDMDSFHVEQPG
jgi:hypothetical protein